MENFESISVLAEEKCSIYSNTKTKGFCFVNSDDPMLSVDDSLETISFSSNSESNFQMKYLGFKNGKMLAECNNIEMKLSILGKHLLTNVAVAFAIGKIFSISDHIIKTQLEFMFDNNQRISINFNIR